MPTNEFTAAQNSTKPLVDDETPVVVSEEIAKRKLVRKVIVIAGATTGLILGGALFLFKKDESGDSESAGDDAPTEAS